MLEQLSEAQRQGVRSKPALLGPLTYLRLGESKDGVDKLSLLEGLLPVYQELLRALQSEGVEWVQMDEPILVTDLPKEWQDAFAKAYRELDGCGVKLLLATYFGRLENHLPFLQELPVQGLHLDVTDDSSWGMSWAEDEAQQAAQSLKDGQVLSLGVVNGRNIWKTDLQAALDWLEPLHAQLGDRLWLAPSCSLLHVPMDLELEGEMEPQLKSWLAFAAQKIEEVRCSPPA